MLAKILQLLLGKDETTRKLDELTTKVDILLQGVEQCNQLILLHMQAMGIDVRLLTPEELDEETKKQRTTAGKGLN